MARQCEAVSSCGLLKGRGWSLLACVGREVVARELDGPEVDRDRAVVGPAAERAEGIGERGGDLDPGEVADWLVDASKKGGDGAVAGIGFWTGSATNGSAQPSSASQTSSGAA